MRAPEILSRIAWSSDLHPDTISEIEAAILDLDRRAHGNAQPILHPIDVGKRLRKYVARYPSSSAAAKALGISRQWLHDLENGRRAYPPGVQQALGVRRVSAPERYEEI